ncbi:MAG: RNA polymerase sigma factor [Planctomycetota bacterium]|jgi:RNA polymerase sigma-70 factor (ECF subfamily)
MKYSRRVEIFEQVRAKYAGFLASVLWKLAGDRELFAEAMQYALLGMWRNVEKLNGEKAGAYIYRIALTANSAAWRNRIGKDGEFARSRIGTDYGPDEKLDREELTSIVRREIGHLPAKQGRAIVMRYLEQLDYKDIAEKLRCTEAGARSNVSKALANLKAKLGNLIV